MFLRSIYDDRLAQAAYLVGCQKTGEAIVFDPERDVDRYIALAAKNGLRIVAAAETHIHADFLCGVREMAEKTGCKVFVSAEGGADWQSRWLNKKTGGGSYPHQLLHDGDTFGIGNIEFRVLHTPGHTPEHVCYLVTDRGGGAAEPMGIISGDFMFVGDLGRPDLLESAAGVKGAKDTSARELFKSVQGFIKLPEYLQVWPAHGAGSACGKSLGAVPQTTVGYEKRVNPALGAAGSERTFVDFILAGQPEPPLYFARMKRQNRDGVPALGVLPKPGRVTAEQLGTAGQSTTVVDTRPWKAFREGHITGSIFAPMDNMFHAVVGSYVGETDAIHLIVEESRVEEAVRDLVRIGLDKVVAYSTPGDVEQARGGGIALECTDEIDPGAAKARIAAGDVFLLDVRRADEFALGHIEGAMHVAYPRLAEHLAEIPKDRPVLVNCHAGGRSARACAFLQRNGYSAINLAGGYSSWVGSGAGTQQPTRV